ncbi:MAG: threonine synthase, partial [Synergistetes bacterium HGW-Synergistetes-2]
RIAVVVTGNGLKDIESARKSVGAPMLVEPTIEDFSGQLERSGFPC